MRAETMQKNGSAKLEKLFVEQIKDLYDAEHQLMKALPKMAKEASSEELKSAFENHLQATRQHAQRLERIFSELNVRPGRKKCAGMQGLLEEGSEATKKKEEGPMKDAEMIAAAQKVEHYEIAGYGTVRTFAERLGLENAVELLQQTLDEEGETDKQLTEISETLLNQHEEQPVEAQ